MNDLARQAAENIQPGSYDDAMEIAKLVALSPNTLTPYGVGQAILAAGYRKQEP